LFCISFVGTNYHGSQIQENAVTVQGEFQRALKSVLGYLPDIKACSRTDSGVHARRFYISVRTHNDLSNSVIKGLNHYLPPDIRVMSMRNVPDDFHARYSALGKRYEYLVYNRDPMDPFYNGFAYMLSKPIDEEYINETARVFVGYHDFTAFCTAPKEQDNRRTVTDFSVKRDGDIVKFSVSADGFLYNMVRVMVGTLLSVSRGKLDSAGIYDIMGSCKRSNLSVTAPACGLYLDEVFYDFGESDDKQG